MALAPNSIVTPQRPVTGIAKVVAAYTNLDAPGANALLLLAAQTDGQRITRVTAYPSGTCVAGDLVLFASSDGGTTKRMIRQFAVPAVTVSAGNTAAIAMLNFLYFDSDPLLLMAGEALYVGSSVAQTNGLVVRAEGSAYS